MANISEVSSSLSNTDSSTSSVAFCFLGGGAEVAFHQGDLDFNVQTFCKTGSTLFAVLHPTFSERRKQQVGETELAGSCR